MSFPVICALQILPLALYMAGSQLARQGAASTVYLAFFLLTLLTGLPAGFLGLKISRSIQKGKRLLQAFAWIDLFLAGYLLVIFAMLFGWMKGF